jgi:excisionase family DNA binding protein
LLSPLPTAGGGIAYFTGGFVMGIADFSINNHLQLLTAKEVALVLNISRAMAYRLLQHGELTSVRIGNSVRVLPEDLEAYIKSRRSNKPLAG